MRRRASRTCGARARARQRIGAVAVVQVLAASCVPGFSLLGTPCDIDACLGDFRCCNGVCIDEGEQCLGECARPVTGVGADRYLPFVPGSAWGWEVKASATDQVTSYKHMRLGAEEDLAPDAEGRAHRLCREDRSIEDVVQRGSISWQRDTGQGAHRIRNLRIDPTGVTKDELCLPYDVRLDEGDPSRCAGAVLDNPWTSRTVDDPLACTGGPSACPTSDTEIGLRWETKDVAAPMPLPGHGEQPALHVRRRLDLGEVDEITDLWFVRGVGKVQEHVPTDEDERLIYYDIPGVGSGGVNPFRTIGECTPQWLPGFP